MDSNVKGITFEKDADGHDRYVRFDLHRYAQQLQPVLDELGVVKPPEGWEDGLTSDEFLVEMDKMLRKKFDERNKIR